jgi:predicted nucleotidyltransferase
VAERDDVDLPQPVQRALAEVVRAARQALGDGLRAVVLFGSAAEGRLRATSDVNVVIVSSAFERPAVDGLRETLRLAEAAVRLRPMFLLADEIGPASWAFAAKFADLRRRRRVLWGEDVFAGLEIPRAAQVARLRQVLLDLGLRLRAAYALRSLREEQLALVLAEAAGPLRSCAALLLELQGRGSFAPREALALLAGAGARDALAHLSAARERRPLPPGVAGTTLFTLLDVIAALRGEAERLE